MRRDRPCAVRQSPRVSREAGRSRGATRLPVNMRTKYAGASRGRGLGESPCPAARVRGSRTFRRAASRSVPLVEVERARYARDHRERLRVSEAEPQRTWPPMPIPASAIAGSSRSPVSMLSRRCRSAVSCGSNSGQTRSTHHDRAACGRRSVIAGESNAAEIVASVAGVSPDSA